MADEDKKDEVVLEAYPAAERVKSEILNRLSSMNESLAGFLYHSTARSKKNPRMLNAEATKYWRQYQVSLLGLYQFLKPNIDNWRKKDYVGVFTPLDMCFVDLVRGEAIKRDLWIDLGNSMSKFVYDLGITKIELDTKARDDILNL